MLIDWQTPIKTGSDTTHQGAVMDCDGEESPGAACAQTRVMTAAAKSYELQPSLARDCEVERKEFCADVKPGMSRIYNCLAAKAIEVRTFSPCPYSLLCRHSLWERVDAGMLRDCKVRNIDDAAATR